MPEESEYNAKFEEAIRNAKADGRFQGEVLSQLKSLNDTMQEMNKRDKLQDELIADKVGSKVFDDLQRDVRDLQKRVYIGVGVIAAVQILIGIVLSK